MSNGRKLSGSHSNQSQPKIFPPGTSSSDSSSALTVENVKRLEEEYMTSKEAFTKQRIEDYIKQTNPALFDKETIENTSTELVWGAEPEEASTSFPTRQRVDSCPPSSHSRRHGMEDEMTQKEWSYSDEFLAARKKGTRISFRFSKQNEYAVRPQTAPFKKQQPTAALPEDLLEPDSEFVAEHLKHCHAPEPVRRCYPDGQTFSLLFPDGSGQVYYPSGNIAILITFTEEALFTYCILEDSGYPEIRAAFESHGHGVCFHPDGHLWAVLDPCTGICLDQLGSSQKCWKWHDFSHHTHSPPFQSITMKLNVHITIKILAQDQISLSFTSHSDHICFNVGSRLKLKDPRTSHLLKWPESEEDLFLQSKKIQLRRLLAKIQTVFWQPPSQ